MGKEAEKIVLGYFRTKRNIHLVKRERGERGFDFRTKDSRLFVEVKGSTSDKLSKAQFRYFTNTEYEKARECFSKKSNYKIHLVLRVGTGHCKQYKIPAKVFIE